MSANLPTLMIEQDAALPDKNQWIHRFLVEGSSGFYTVAQHRTERYWGCGCMGWRTHKDRNCKHLRQLGLPGELRPHEVDFRIRGAVAAPQVPPTYFVIARETERELAEAVRVHSQSSGFDRHIGPLLRDSHTGFLLQVMRSAGPGPQTTPSAIFTAARSGKRVYDL